MQKELIELRLQEIPLDKDYRGIPGLRELAEIAGIGKASTAKKSMLIKELMALYGRPHFVRDCFLSLSKGEQAILSFMVHSGGEAEYDDLMCVVKNNGLKRRQSVSYSVQLSDYYPEKSKIWLLAPGGLMSEDIFEALCKLVGPYQVCTEPVTDAELCVIERQGCAGDFAKLVRQCNQSSMAVTKSDLLSKNGAVAFAKLVGYEEITDTMSKSPDDARTLQKMRVTFGIYLAAIAGGLVRVEKGKAVPGGEATKLLSLSDGELVKNLYRAYQKDKTIHEIIFMTGVKEIGKAIRYLAARECVSGELCKYPVGVLLSVERFIEGIRICNKRFLRKYKNDAVYTGNSGALCEFRDIEVPFIQMVLSVYGALGMLDIGWGMREVSVALAYSDETEMLCVPVAFRITPLGAWVLGLTETYEEPKTKGVKAAGGFLVQPDYSIMVEAGKARIGHELYFERFLKKKSDDAQMTVYYLEVQGVLNALNLGITVEALAQYLESGSEKPLPENVRRTLSDWAEMAKKIRIRNVTVLETEDPVLLEELLHLKGMGELTCGKIAAAAIVAPGAGQKIKKLIEKSNRYCKDEFTR